MSWVGSRETGLDSLFASKPIGPGFEPCLGQSAKLAGAPKLLCLCKTKPLCLSVCLCHGKIAEGKRSRPAVEYKLQASQVDTYCYRTQQPYLM